MLARAAAAIMVMSENEPTDLPTLGYATPAHPRSPWPVVVPAAALHFVVFVALFFYTFKSGMARFDSGAPPTAFERAARTVVYVLSFPLLHLLRAARIHVPGLGGWIVIAANSLCWGFALWLVVRMFRRFRPAA